MGASSEPISALRRLCVIYSSSCRDCALWMDLSHVSRVGLAMSESADARRH